jgi:hypothetical protein
MASDDDSRIDLSALTDAVKSRILDRVLADIRDHLTLGCRASGYTKSDSGIYGKYQKADVDLAGILAAARSQLDALLAEYQHSGSESAGSDEPETPEQSRQS